MHTAELLAEEKPCFWLSRGYCGRDAEVLRGGLRVNIEGWMRQSAAFTYRWGEESDLAPFHGSLHLQKLDWKQKFWALWNIKVCACACESVCEFKSQLSRGQCLQKAAGDTIISNSISTSIYPLKSIKISPPGPRWVIKVNQSARKIPSEMGFFASLVPTCECHT